MWWLLLLPVVVLGDAEKIVIAHRGASGYLPEHTLEAKAMAVALGADYIEQDLVMTKDNVLIVMHDINLDTTTDVASKFPGRSTPDGHYNAINFTLAEIKTLHVSERFSTLPNKTKVPAFSDRFPLFKSYFRVPTFEEELQLVRGMEKSYRKTIGIYPEIKKPWFHRKHGRDITTAVLQMLKKYNFTKKTDKIFLQCFDPNELINGVVYASAALGMSLKTVQLIPGNPWGSRETLVEKTLPNGTIEWVPYDYSWIFQAVGALSGLGMSIPLIQLMAENDWEEAFEETTRPDGSKTWTPVDYNWMFQGIGPWHPMLVNTTTSTRGHIVSTGLAERAHAAGLLIHPYTFRRERSQLPKYVNSLSEFIQVFYYQVPVDGLFTDFPDVAVAVLKGGPSSNAVYSLAPIPLSALVLVALLLLL